MQASTWQLMPRSAAGGDVGDRVDDALRVLRRRADDQHGVVVDRRGHGVDVGPPIVSHGDAAVLEAEVVGAFSNAAWADGEYDVRPADAPLDQAPLPGGFDGEEDALGAAGGHERRPPAAVEPAAHDGDDVLLDPPEARERIRVERVLGHEAAVRVLGHRADLGQRRCRPA